MAWVRISSKFHDDPVIEQIGNEAAGVFIRILSYCVDHKTDGFISTSKSRRISSKKVLEKLVFCGLIVVSQAGEVQSVTGRRDSGRRRLADVDVICMVDGYFVPKFLHHNLSKAEIQYREKVSQ